MSDLQERLEAFYQEKKFKTKGPLSVALFVTDFAKSNYPIDPETLISKSGTQVAGLSMSPVQTILSRHGIEKVLSREAGRTSRGSVKNMKAYVEFLNKQNDLDLDIVEKFWIGKVLQFFAAKPFTIRTDSSVGLRAIIQDLLAQAENRQKEGSGTYYAGTVMQHLVGAKLECALRGEVAFDHHGASTSDQQSGRAGDFAIGNAAIHVTTSPGEALIGRCKDNLNSDVKPIIVTSQRGVTVAEGLAENANLGNRIDIFEITQFIALNIYEIGLFSSQGNSTTISDIVNKYNTIINTCETDPSLKIDLK